MSTDVSEVYAASIIRTISDRKEEIGRCIISIKINRPTIVRNIWFVLQRCIVYAVCAASKETTGCDISGSHDDEYEDDDSHPDNGGSTHLGNVGEFRDYTALHPRKL
jgi:hypothetical protein